MMNNLPLQPLVFGKHNIATSPFYEYQSHPDTESKGKWMVKIAPLNSKKADEPARGFATKQDAQDWVNSTHYPHTMQPYIKPLPTWIDAKKQLPQVDVDTQFICAYDSALEPYVRVATFSVEMNDFGLDGDVLAWMPIPEFKESDCE